MPSAGKAMPHDAALGHVTGQAPYIDDLRPLAGELYVGFVGSPVAAGQVAERRYERRARTAWRRRLLHGGRCAGPQYVRRRRDGRTVSGRWRAAVSGPTGGDRGGRISGRT